MRRRLQAAILGFLVACALVAPALAQDMPIPPADRSVTGGAQTRDDIMARQAGQTVAPRQRDDAAGAAAALEAQLGIRGPASDSDTWFDLRTGNADVTVSSGGPVAKVLIQDSGMAWYQFRSGPLKVWGGYLLLFTLGALALFYLIRGRIRIEGEKTGRRIERFKAFERFSHWLLAGSFIILGLTGLITLFGRVAIIPLLGHEAFTPIAIASKWVHNNIAWGFMLSLVFVFFLWVWHNIPSRLDLVWLAKGGGLFSKGVHPPARKFNAGQKMIFWGVIVLGGSISLSGLSLLFPFELPMFAKTFAVINDIGVMGWFGRDPLPTTLAPHTEMQLASLWHAIVSFAMMALVFAHIYIGSLGMEGAYDAMGTGQVELQWAREHHGLWVEEVTGEADPGHAAPPATPAE